MVSPSRVNPAWGIAVLLVSETARAKEIELPGEVGVRLGLRLAGAYDDNALLGRRGQFLDSPSGSGPKADVAALPGIDLTSNRRFGRDQLLAEGRMALTALRLAESLRGFDALGRLGFDKSLGDIANVVPELLVAYHSEDVHWAYRLVQPSVAASATFDFGLFATLRYRFAAQDYARTASGTPEPKNSYGNIDRRSHTAELDLRMWLGRSVRLNLVADGARDEYGGNLNRNLAGYAGLSPGAPRVDWGGGATLSALVVPHSAVLLTAGARYELNRSNARPFVFWAVRGIADGLWRVWREHYVYASVDYGRYDFPLERFDRRYANTRIDYRREIALAYRWEPAEDLRVEVTFRRQDSVSNDCAAFSPERDEEGLPVYSRSYSCFARNRFEIAMRYEL